MKKSAFWKVMLMVLPIAAVGLATTGNSVTVFDIQAETVAYYSYFDLVDAGTLQMAAPLAAVLSGVSGILAAVYLGVKKNGCLKAIQWTAFLAVTFAVLPVLSRGGVRVVPNVLLPILMLAEAILARVLVKKPLAEGQNAPRLSPR